MMYKNNVAIAIKAGGKVLREQAGAVLIPFGSEYSVFVKNINSVRVKFRLNIDGADALSNREIIVEPKSSVEIERYIRNGNMNQGNKFKFIERTLAVESHRGAKVEDGLVSVEVFTEQPAPKITHEYHYEHHYPWYSGPCWGSTILRSTGMRSGTGGMRSGAGFASGIQAQVNNTSMSTTNGETRAFAQNMAGIPAQNDAGITVDGGFSEQKFVDGGWFLCQPGSDVITLQLKGYDGAMPVRAAVTVKHKPSCSTCGKSNKANSKFCAQCGTSLIQF